MTEAPVRQSLTEESCRHAVTAVSGQDAVLAGVVSKWGIPPFWVHPPGFPGIVLAILGQQVSLESAQATFNKLGAALGAVEPEPFLGLGDEALRAAGFSRQKASYVRGVASRIVSGEFDPAELESLDDDAVRARLTGLRGIGAWTADTYLLFALRRPDAWPTGDLALAKAVQELESRPQMPTWAELDEHAERWRPWRAVAARLLWHHYLSERGRTG